MYTLLVQYKYITSTNIREGLYWESRPNQHLVYPHDWQPLHNTQMYAILPSYDLLGPFSMLLDASS
jgi:hypothetical protein